MIGGGKGVIRYILDIYADSILIIFYFTLSRLKGTLKFVLTYIICSVSLSKTYREKMISRTLYLLKKATGIKIIYD